jgi:hypothetical protein
MCKPVRTRAVRGNQLALYIDTAQPRQLQLTVMCTPTYATALYYIIAATTARNCIHTHFHAMYEMIYTLLCTLLYCVTLPVAHHSSACSIAAKQH